MSADGKQANNAASIFDWNDDEDENPRPSNGKPLSVTTSGMETCVKKASPSPSSSGTSATAIVIEQELSKSAADNNENQQAMLIQTPLSSLTQSDTTLIDEKKQLLLIKTTEGGPNLLGLDNLASPGVMLSPNGAKSVQRQRRSTGSNKSTSSNKASDGIPEEEDPQTKERINAILEMAKKEEEANKKLLPFTTVGPHSQASTIITPIPSTAGGATITKTIMAPVTLPGTPTSVTIPGSGTEQKTNPHVPVAVTPQMTNAKPFTGLIQPLPVHPQSLAQAIRQQKPVLPATTVVSTVAAATVISTSLQSSQQKAMPRATATGTLQGINPTATSANIKGQPFPNISQSQAQLPQPTVLSQRQGIQQQITVQPVSSKVSAPTQLTALPAGVTILRPQQVTSTSIHTTGQATQILNPALPSSAAAVVSTIRQPLPASTLPQQGSKVSISPSSPSIPLVQLPTQPIPPSEIRTTKQVLLEPKSAPPKISIPSTSPRTTSITLPTQPVPRSTAMASMPSANGASSSSVSVSSVVNVRPLPRSQVPTPASMIQTMLPNQPLPMTTAFSSVRPGSIVVTSSTISAPTTLQYTPGFGTTASYPTHLFPSSPVVSSPLHSPNMVTVTTGPPRLPQHPLPPTTSTVSACKIEPVDVHQQQQPRTVVALKKREIMMTKDLQNEIKTKEEIIAGMAKASLQSQPEYLKPRDAYGGRLRLQQAHKQELLSSDLAIKDEKSIIFQQGNQPTSAVTILPGQSPSSTASYPPAHLVFDRGNPTV